MKIEIILIFIIIMSCAAFANIGQPCSAVEVAAPEKIPQRVILTWSGDPTTTQAVTWRTTKKCTRSMGQIAVATAGPDIEKDVVAFGAFDEKVTLEKGGDVYYHTVNFKNLNPATLYAYRVGDGEVWSEWNQFRTADINDAPFKFIYVGDVQNDILNSWSRVIRTAYAAAPDSKFIVHGGDMVQCADNDEQWQQWFDAGGWIFRVMPSVPCMGNHEQLDVWQLYDLLGNSIFWRPQFDLPVNGPNDLQEFTYYFDYKNTRFFVLNGSKYIDKQAKWLDKILADTKSKWKIAVIHQPLFTGGTKTLDSNELKIRDNVEIRKAFEPIFDKYGIDLVLQGHDHVYSRTHKTYGSKVVDNSKNGTVYCTSISGPKHYIINTEFENLMAKKVTQTQLFQIISINSDRLIYDAYSVNLISYDHFELTKSVKANSSILSE